jgi:hypothetical protein
MIATGGRNWIGGNRIIGSPSLPYDLPAAGSGDSFETMTWRRSARVWLPGVLVQANN